MGNLYEAIKNNRDNFELTAEALTEVPKIEEKEHWYHHYRP